MRLFSPAWIALAIQAILFGAVHWYGSTHTISGTIVATGIGFFLGLVYLKTGKIWLSMIFHSLINIA